MCGLSKGSPVDVLEVAFQLSGLAKHHSFIDLGCRDGRVPQLANLLTGCDATGVEIDPEYSKKAEQHSRKLGVKTTIITGDMFHMDLNRFDVIYIFQTGATLKKLSEKLRREASHAMIITLDYPLCNWMLSNSVNVGNHKLFFYGMNNRWQ